jgi:phosphatidylethanolamine/phosphatidyl-N-methylethanolamine N-methyltransferase
VLSLDKVSKPDGREPFPLTLASEHKTHFLTKIFRSPYYGCYALGVTIFGLGIFRDYLYKTALSDQPRYPPIHQPILAYGLIASGNVLVLSSMWALGVTGTYLGDYFGILMDSRVEGFPFNVTRSPMYWGSTMSFLGAAVLTGKVAGLILTAEVFVMYLIALQFEEYVAFSLLWRMLTTLAVLSRRISMRRGRLKE